MKLKNNLYAIEVTSDDAYRIDGPANGPYDLVLNPRNITKNDIHKALSLCIEAPDGTSRVAIVTDGYTQADDAAVLEDDALVVLLNDVVVRLDIKALAVTLAKRLDCTGCNFGIYRTRHGYVLHGELEVIMLGFGFDRKWSFSGRDIFVSNSGEKPFELCNDSIRLRDFDGNFYEIDFSGRLIASVLQRP